MVYMQPYWGKKLFNTPGIDLPEKTYHPAMKMANILAKVTFIGAHI